MTFDLQGALRRLKPQRSAALRRRSDAELAFVEDEPLTGPPLLLDTCVYIDILQARDPGALRPLLNGRARRHSAVCLAELAHVFGRLDPSHPGTAKALAEVGGVIESDIPRHRIEAPDVECWGAAGILGGLLFRLGGFQKGQEKALLADALILLQAAKSGCTVLTSNVAHFDLLNQLLPASRVLFYRAAGTHLA